MPNQLSAAVAEAYASADKTATYIDTLTITAGSMQPIRVCLGYEAFTDSSGNVFQAYPFEIDRPNAEPGAEPVLTVRFSNVSRAIGDKLAVAINSRTPIYANYRGFVVSDSGFTNEAESFLLPMRVKSVDITHGQSGIINVKCGWDSLQNKAFPPRLITVTRFPGLIE